MNTKETIIKQLEKLGLQNYSAVMVHTSMRKVGKLEGGANALIDALLQTLGPQGSLVMVLGANDDEPFDALTTEADEDMGVVPEMFREHSGVQVNDHAAARYAVHGPHAEFLLNPTQLHDYHGPGSVLDRLTELNGAVLRLGANTDTVTLTHLAEYLADVPDKRRVSLRYERADSGEQWINSLDDSDGIAEWSEGDYFPRILLDYLKTGIARIGLVGDSEAELFPATSFVEFAKEWIESNLRLESRTPS
ncbi:MAG: hypothetical protein COB20_07735 [SAR86 cluster bacterium]|uniref:Aminoglycoside N(3)-acetyltransferase n=1 Tax=SAR86 cluster bacterium TaxID=2030880 RepID=A0A2A4X6C0_9GAMM|nr:MAG: hypothetical protein COB20_07735 [SAR86 cluster bacterium]